MMLDIVAAAPSVRPSGLLADHYRFPAALIPHFRACPDLDQAAGFFRFGPALCYGQALGQTQQELEGPLFDAARHVQSKDSGIVLPFDLEQVIDNLRYERYVRPSARRWLESPWIKKTYYRFRPLLPISVRSQLQKVYLKDWNAIEFPSWPVDRSADLLFESVLADAMRTLHLDRLPFIWFWPKGHAACAIMTHDVEELAGRDFCTRLMDIDDAFGIKSSFQIVPDKRYPVPPDYLKEIRDRGCEVNVQGLDHDGNLFQNRETFLDAARKINQFAELFASRGFRSPVLYRNADWFQDLNFSYDMSVPNVARLEAQRGGCCTVMPYFLPGRLTELPVTTTEDYTLFHILKDYSTTLWRKQMSMILEGHGLMSFIVHPDYVVDNRAQDVYRELLEELCRLQSESNLWITLPGEVDRWWRERSRMKLMSSGHGRWAIEGPGSHRAMVAYAHLEGHRLVYEVEPKQS
jgi:hypothetical protein